MRKIYFAFGANTSTASMAARCPASKPIGKAILHDYGLVFRGEADIQVSQNAAVHGALWSITKECERSLDRFEGFPHLYVKKLVYVSHQDHGDVEAMVYVMRNNSSLEPPKQAYVNLIAEGYSDFGIPAMQLLSAIEVAKQAYGEEIEMICKSELSYSIGR
jgi:gamma-glutamylcyclotransferase (GGCT)/AIG2-like uncharacterized protein YtfP